MMMQSQCRAFPMVLALAIAGLNPTLLHATDYLPPIAAWHGASEALVQSQGQWVTPAEQSGLTTSPSYADTVAYLTQLVRSSPYLQMETIGKSPQGRDIWLVKAGVQPQQIGQKNKPVLLIQAGIHSGEIDGKDAGLMLLRDIVHGGKQDLLKQVDLLFIPILSVDAHERRSAFNRMNQRGPVLQGWRNTAENLNINRDYSKLDTLELQAVLNVINQYQPTLYLDIHVTDGEDYQYDITYGFNRPEASQSPAVARWLRDQYRPAIDQALRDKGHLPSDLVFGLDPLDFSKGLRGWTATPRYSNGYGDVRHLPTVLIENHSLKPFRQRVLGTYVLLEQTIRLLGQQGEALQAATIADQKLRPTEQVLQYKAASSPERIDFAGIDYKVVQSTLSLAPYMQWTGQAKSYKDFPVYWETEKAVTAQVPKAYWVPPQYQQVLARLAMHGINMTTLTQPALQPLQQLTASDVAFAANPTEGRFAVTANFSAQQVPVALPKGAVRVSTDQPLGALAVALLQPEAPDSLFHWGFFHSMFERTEYFETYAILPWIEQQLKHNAELSQAFAQAQKTDPRLVTDGEARVQWFYQRSPFYDQSYLKYPVLLEW